ncbi:MAG: ATP-binding protein [Verrucomicrobiota bacterium]
MESRRRSYWVYGLLFAAWVLILWWQSVEHSRVRTTARTELRNRAKDISTTVGVVLRSQRIFGLISKERLESALADLIRPGELLAVAMLNTSGEIVASAPTNSDLQAKATSRQAELWETETVTLMNLVDLGTSVASEFDTTNPPVVLSREAFVRPGETNRPPPPPSGIDVSNSSSAELHSNTNRSKGDGERRSRRDGDGRDRDRERRSRFGRPPWMSEAEFATIIQKQGVHSFLTVLSTRSVAEATHRDFWMRFIIVGLTTLSVAGFGLAWRNTLQTAELQIRLVRASEMNTHLKEMNLAAAGLAHETRNPLNIIRGLAQMISKRADTPSDTRMRSMEIVNEADRVAGQLNDFINYSRPREVRHAPVVLNRVADEVARALSFDVEEKQLQLRVTGEALTVEADEQLLRQALFNLALNAVQAVAAKGEIEIRTVKNSATEATLEVRDNGPGVPVEERAAIFKPYFTTTQKGTGLGLAVVQQIVLAHGWEIECVANDPKGACFRLQHIKLVR